MAFDLPGKTSKTRRLPSISVTHRKNQEVVIAIHNTGSYIPEEKINEIFKPFYINKSTGTGVGLALTKRIIDAHEGQINVMSDQYASTTFEVVLPTVTDTITKSAEQAEKNLCPQ